MSAAPDNNVRGTPQPGMSVPAKKAMHRPTGVGYWAIVAVIATLFAFATLPDQSPVTADVITVTPGTGSAEVVTGTATVSVTTTATVTPVAPPASPSTTASTTVTSTPIDSFRARAVTGTVDLTLVPQTSTTLGPNHTIDVDVFFRAGSQEIDTLDLHLLFDQQKLQVNALTNVAGTPNPFPQQLDWRSDNARGTIDITLGKLTGTAGTGAIGYFRVVRITLKATNGAVTSGTSASVTSLSFASTTNARRAGVSYIRNTRPLTLSVNPSAGIPVITPTTTAIILERGIGRTIDFSIADATNSPLSNGTWRAVSYPDGAVNILNPTGSVGAGGTVSLNAEGGATFGSGVIDLEVTSPSLPGGSVTLSRITSSGAATKTATATNTQTSTPTVTATPTNSPTVTATPTSTPTSTPTVTPTQTSTPTPLPNLSLEVGWNLVALRNIPTTPMTASSLCTTLTATQTGTALEVNRWESGGWVGHVCGFPPNDFTLKSGSGYFVRVTRASVIPSSALSTTSPATLTGLALDPGWNLVALRDTPATPVMASAVCATQNSVTSGTLVEIDLWEAGGWVGHVCGFPPNDFAFVPGAAYFVRMTRAGTWPY